jgi:hypothetical protein
MKGLCERKRQTQWGGESKGEVAKLKHRETKESVKHNTSLQKRVNYLIRLNQK